MRKVTTMRCVEPSKKTIGSSSISGIGPGLRSGKSASGTVGKAVRLAVVCTLLLTGVQAALGQTETVLYSFCSLSDCSDGALPIAGLVIDGKGNLYGADDGAVFKVSPTGTETVLSSIGTNAGLIRDKAGNLYGTTQEQGGTVFKITSNGTRSILYSFVSQSLEDGYEPLGGVVFDKAGNLYGTTFQGGANGAGTVFKLTHNSDDTWTENVLYSFCSLTDCADGSSPWGGLAIDAKGNLYGMTYSGGATTNQYCPYGCGIVFKVTPTGTETVLHSFAGIPTDGCNPLTGNLVLKSGALYGVTPYCGAYGGGTVFKITLKGKETVLYSFGADDADGFGPFGTPTFDKSGNLYGTTWTSGPSTPTWGTVWQLTPSGVETILHYFGGYPTDGGHPQAGVVFDKNGNLYGTTYLGGVNDLCGGTQVGCGTVFKLIP